VQLVVLGVFTVAQHQFEVMFKGREELLEFLCQILVEHVVSDHWKNRKPQIKSRMFDQPAI